jgi:hypothetical protein
MLKILRSVFDHGAGVDHCVDMGWLGRSERVMPGHPTVPFLIVFEQREVEDPKQPEFIFLSAGVR